MEEKIQLLQAAEDNRKEQGQMLRSCDEIRLFDPTKPSGRYRIDPDGPLVGDDPMTVHCDMDTGE
jgi:Fibrillar collagen C-terminal domain